MAHTPTSNIDLFTQDSITNPYALYKELRDLGPVVWLTTNKIWAIPRYEEVKFALKTWDTFVSSRGVAMDAAVNAATSGPKANSLTTDRPLHDDIRRITSAPLLPGALKDIKPLIEETARKTIEELCGRESFEGMSELAQVLPLTIVSDLVGLPTYGRESMLRWAAATFNAMGPMNDRGKSAVEEIKELHEFCLKEAIPGKLRPGSWADRIYKVVGDNKALVDRCPAMMREYIGPSLDTTIFATGHILRLLGENPSQWALLRNEPALIPAAIDEALRLESPVRTFTRFVQKDTELAGTVLPAESRVLIMFASANRDERKWERPEEFVVTRRPTDHLAFGHGIHTCAGMHLARLEITSLLTAMIEKVDTIQVGKPEVFFNNTLGGYASLPMRFNRG
ncbi:cytochrome P450 [Bradyrhizobium sp. CCBAU 53338]|uniref:cytochrome P450 n=1 Tax=Bradyrhizobium sp. CCBAU 53338 TaxID=1325111 RepID=UPI00188D589E|nr:cytochrome P450 [Bradyrhizobium sp. CCBAU 53338]QOZ52524.1 cytochrome P450 [Bradyrhizobium sp. CCBAU 53338]